MAAVVSPGGPQQPTVPSTSGKSIARLFRSSLQETLRHVAPAGRKSTSQAPSAFSDRQSRPSAIRRSLDAASIVPQARRDAQREPPARRSFDALTHKSGGSQGTGGSQASSERDRERPRVLRKQPSSTKRRAGAESPPPELAGM